MSNTAIRFVDVKGQKYVLLEDVVQYLRNIGASEETDIRTLFNVIADNLQYGKKYERTS